MKFILKFSGIIWIMKVWKYLPEYNEKLADGRKLILSYSSLFWEEYLVSL